MMRPQHSQLRNHLRARHVDRGRGSGITRLDFLAVFAPTARTNAAGRTRGPLRCPKIAARKNPLPETCAMKRGIKWSRSGENPSKIEKDPPPTFYQYLPIENHTLSMATYMTPSSFEVGLFTVVLITSNALPCRTSRKTDAAVRG